MIFHLLSTRAVGMAVATDLAQGQVAVAVVLLIFVATN
jgi:hypothetical protein